MANERNLPDPMQIALGYAAPLQRPAWQTLFALDVHLGLLTSQVREPMLGQLRLAWWRDALAMPAEAQPKGEPLLADSALHLSRSATVLSELASGWEFLLGDAPLAQTPIERYLGLRSAAYAAMAAETGHSECSPAATLAAHWWVLGDTFARLTDAQERNAVLALASRQQQAPPLPKALRPLAVLAGLGRRAVQLRQPVLEGRASALAALRLGMFGR